VNGNSAKFLQTRFSVEIIRKRPRERESQTQTMRDILMLTADTRLSTVCSIETPTSAKGSVILCDGTDQDINRSKSYSKERFQQKN
jgi:hypothetical protein